MIYAYWTKLKIQIIDESHAVVELMMFESVAQNTQAKTPIIWVLITSIKDQLSAVQELRQYNIKMLNIL